MSSLHLPFHEGYEHGREDHSELHDEATDMKERAAEMTNFAMERGKQKKYGQNRNYPGYVQPNREGKRQVSAFLDEELALAFKEAVRVKGTTIQNLIEDLALHTVSDMPLARDNREKILEADLARYRKSRKEALGLS